MIFRKTSSSTSPATPVGGASLPGSVCRIRPRTRHPACRKIDLFPIENAFATGAADRRSRHFAALSFLIIPGVRDFEDAPRDRSGLSCALPPRSDFPASKAGDADNRKKPFQGEIRGTAGDAQQERERRGQEPHINLQYSIVELSKGPGGAKRHGQEKQPLSLSRSTWWITIE